MLLKQFWAPKKCYSPNLPINHLFLVVFVQLPGAFYPVPHYSVLTKLDWAKIVFPFSHKICVESSTASHWLLDKLNCCFQSPDKGYNWSLALLKACRPSEPKPVFLLRFYFCILSSFIFRFIRAHSFNCSVCDASKHSLYLVQKGQELKLY